RIKAGFTRRQARIRKAVHEVRDTRERHEVELHVLARGDVPSSTGELVGDVCKRFQLSSRRYSTGDLRADHLNAGLPLAVNAVTQPERTEFVVRNCAGENLFCFCAESLDFLANGLLMLAFEVGADCQA